MMWKVDCSVKNCAFESYYEAPTKDAARALAVDNYVHYPVSHSNTWYFIIVPYLEAK
jgi:hypothetical protein